MGGAFVPAGERLSGGSFCPGAFVRLPSFIQRKKHEVHLQIYALSECSPALISIYVTVVILFGESSGYAPVLTNLTPLKTFV